MVVEHDALLRSYYTDRSTRLARDLVARRIDDAEHDRRIAALVQFIGPDTIAMWADLGVGEGAA
jgi:hypothetical protein